MYWRDHAPPHFHAFCQGFEALVDIDTLAIIAGSLPVGARRIVVEWATRHRAELRENWERGRRTEAFALIRGADSE